MLGREEGWGGEGANKNIKRKQVQQLKLYIIFCMLLGFKK